MARCHCWCQLCLLEKDPSVGSKTEKSGKVTKILVRQKMDACCVQETWKYNDGEKKELPVDVNVARMSGCELWCRYFGVSEFGQKSVEVKCVSEWWWWWWWWWWWNQGSYKSPTNKFKGFQEFWSVIFQIIYFSYVFNLSVHFFTRTSLSCHTLCLQLINQSLKRLIIQQIKELTASNKSYHFPKKL